MDEQLTEAITQGFHAAGFNFREGEWDMERAAKAIAPPIEALLVTEYDRGKVETLKKLLTFKSGENASPQTVVDHIDQELKQLKSKGEVNE